MPRCAHNQRILHSTMPPAVQKIYEGGGKAVYHMKKVALIMGSDSDLPIVTPAVKQLKELGIETEVRVMSAHRTPKQAQDFAENAAKNGFGVIIAAAGMAAHLGGVLAASTTLPVIGIPCSAKVLDGMDAMLATVMMPPGIPVATVGVNAAKNAALLAAGKLAMTHLPKSLPICARIWKTQLSKRIRQCRKKSKKSDFVCENRIKLNQI